MTISIDYDEQPTFDQADMRGLIPHIRTFAVSLCRDRTYAEDLIQEALASAWRRRDAFQRGTNLKAWLFTIVRNQFYSERRRFWRVVPFDQQMAEATLVAVTSPNAALELDDLRCAMLQLSDEQRRALTLVTVSGLSLQEAAAICLCPVGTIKSRVSRARTRLVAILASGGSKADRRAPHLAMASMVVGAERMRQQVAA
jgi:RNA polymerase sigma-70 factor (ECF subfamily)